MEPTILSAPSQPFRSAYQSSNGDAGDTLPLLQLPADYPAQPGHRSHWAIHPCSLSVPLVASLDAHSHATATDPTLPLLAAWYALLAGYTQQTSILVGVAGMHAACPSPLPSMLDILLVHTDMLADLPLYPFMQELQRQIQSAMSDPACRVVLPPIQVAAPQQEYRLPCQVLFDVQLDATDPGADLARRLTHCDARSGAPQCSLALAVSLDHDHITAALVYDAERFAPTTIARMSTHWETLLTRMLTQPECPVSQIPLLTETEYQQAVHTWNATTMPYPHDACVHELFAAQVNHTPKNPAVVFEDQFLTYAELDQRANQLAHLLQERGVGPEMLVGVCLDRSLDLPVAWLGILKAGGTYLPLDPTYPADRLAFMLTDAAVTLVLTQTHLVEQLHTLAPAATLLCLDQPATFAAYPSGRPACAALPSSLAYVIYTSGSTGRPKGVLLEHRGLVNLAVEQQQVFAVRPGSRVLQFAALGFDASVWEMAMALLAGGTLYLAPKDALLPGDPLVQVLHSHAITIATLPPTVVASLPLVPLPHLQTLIVAGEACPPELVTTWASGRRIVNAYGPTETTVCATIGTCVADGRRPPIGRPIANTQVYLLDRQMRPVPIGVPGEMYVGGVGVARGYLNRPDLTAARFVANPFGAGRLYRTGDLARWLPDGQIDFLGRIDHQVKVRGFRIEPGEIETVLCQHPAVETGVVIVREDIPGQKRLVAYVVPRRGITPSALPIGMLRQHMQQQVPDYMVPAAFVILEALPRTPNDKLDRAALPAPDYSRNQMSHPYVAPQTPREQTLANIWTRLLHLETVGVNDNFFELGGDSILSIQIIAAAHQQGIHLLPRHIFQSPTIAELATVAEADTPVQAEQGILTGPVPLTPIQHWFFAQNFPDPQHWNQALLLTVPPELCPDHLRQAFAYLLDHHDALRLRFTRTAAGWQQRYGATETELPFAVVDLVPLSPAEQRDALEAHAAQTQANFDLQATPRLRAVLFHLGNGQPQRLLMVINYLAVDGVTWRILLNDLETVYQAIAQGQPVELPAKTTSYRQWAQQLHSYAQQPACLQELAYWHQVTGTPTAPLPLDFPGGDNSEATEQQFTLSLSEEETHALLHDTPQAFHTQINDMLLAALLLAYAHWTGESALRIDLEGHGREDLFADVTVARTVGWFTSFYPVHLRLPEQPSLERTLVAVKEHLRHIPQHGIGYGLLRYLRAEAEVRNQLEHDPRPAIRFNYLGQFDQVMSGTALFRRAPESTGPTRSLRGQRTHLLVIEGLVTEGQLHLTWMYSSNLHRRETIATFAQFYLDALRGLINHCMTVGVGGFTPADFPLARLDHTQLAQLARAAGGWHSIEDILPLAPTQQGILLHSRQLVHAAMYLVQWVGTLRGELDVLAFQHAWHLLVQRHPILRTSFVWEGLDEPQQVVHPHAHLSWTIADWRGVNPAAQQQQVQDWLIQDQRRGIDPTHAPLMRMALFQVADTTWTCVWTFHHAILEGWSTTLLLEELFICYQAHRQHEEPALPAVRPYRDYIAWLQRQDLSQAEGFWRAYLAGFAAPTPLLQAHPHERGEGIFRYANLTILLPQDLTRALHTFARTHQLTLGTILQGVWALLLSRYSSELDVVFGLTVAGRSADLAGVESIIGLCINTIPVRIAVPPDRTILPWLRDLQAQQSVTREFEQTPLMNIQQWSEVPAGTPLFHSLVSFENYPGHTFAVNTGPSDLQLQAEQAIERTNYPLALAIREGDDLEIRWMYDTHAFDAATISRMGQHVQTALADLLAHPEQRLGQVSLLSAAERQRILVDWNNTKVDYPHNQSVHRLFEIQAELTPDAIALIAAGQRMTYRELNARANQLAHHLQHLGVAPEVMVGLCTERSLETIVGMLGILKAGGVYVPLDPSYPAERLALMLSDTQARVLVVQQDLRTILPDYPGPIVWIDRDRAQLDQRPTDNLNLPISPDHLAYVMYTSGSTGRPKGILIPHRGITRLVFGNEYAHFGPRQIFLHIAPLSFDASTFEIWGALLHGATCVLYPDRLPTAEKMGQVIREHQVTTVWITTALFHMVMDEAPMIFNSVEQVLTGGEVISMTHVRRALDLMPATQFINFYGPTESTTFTSYYPMPCPLPASVHALPIGKPIGNTTVYILDRDMQPVPVGVPGELYVGGDGLARGYLARPELTAAKFLPNPFSHTPGARLYRTGDLAGWLPDGNIEFLGRIDQQVKIRGFRIEPGEIEAVLDHHPAVQANVVVARNDGTGLRLVAYVVGEQADPAMLRAYLAERLPAYMVPNLFVQLDTFPLTPGGKVDRRALPPPAAALTREIIGPRTDTEQTLATIWREVLGLEQVGIHENFFEVGGNSLLISRVYTRIQSAMGVSLSLVDLFTYPTIHALADYLAQQEQPAPVQQPVSPKQNRLRQQRALRGRE